MITFTIIISMRDILVTAVACCGTSQQVTGSVIAIAIIMIVINAICSSSP